MFKCFLRGYNYVVMKRMFVFCFVILICVLGYLLNANFSLNYLSEKSSNYVATFSSEINDINFVGVNNGELYHVFCLPNNVKYLKEKYNDKVLAETYVLDKDFDINNFLNRINFKQINQYRIDDKIVVEGYSTLLEKYVVTSSRKMNLQICIGSNIKIGYPYIAEGFW